MPGKGLENLVKIEEPVGITPREYAPLIIDIIAPLS
jgi:hypothetical protein